MLFFIRKEKEFSGRRACLYYRTFMIRPSKEGIGFQENLLFDFE